MTLTALAAYAATRISSNLKGRTKQFGWLQASATRNHSAAIRSEYPTTIRIDNAHRTPACSSDKNPRIRLPALPQFSHTNHIWAPQPRPHLLPASHRLT